MGARILIVHDDDHFLGRATAALQAEGHTVLHQPTVVEALDQLDEAPPPDVLITRMRFAPGGSNGVALANMARQKHPQIKVIFTALEEFARDAEGLGTFLPMPVSLPELVAAVNEALATR